MKTAPIALIAAVVGFGAAGPTSDIWDAIGALNQGQQDIHDTMNANLDAHSDAIRDLQDQVRFLRAEVATLQASPAPTPAPAAANTPPSVDPRLGMDHMVIEQILEIPRPDAATRSLELEQQATAIRDQIRKLADSRTRVNRKRVDLQIQKLEKRVMELAQEHQQVQRPRVYFCGWDGYRDIMLDVSSIPAHRLESMRLGLVVRFDGDVIGKPLGYPYASDYRVIAADRVMEINRMGPDRPDGRLPVWTDGIPQ